MTILSRAREGEGSESLTWCARIVYGVSNNARTFWSITNARKIIGYAPEDDSEVRFAEDIVRVLGR